MKHIYSLFVALTIALSVTGCSVLPTPETETRFVLAPVALANYVAPPQKMDNSSVLGIARPQVPVDLRGSQFVLVKNGEQTFYAGKAWSAPLPDMLSAALVRDLATNLPNWIVTADNGVRKTLELQIEVHDFATLQEDGHTAVVMNMDVRFVNPQDRTVVKALPFRYRAELPALTTAATLTAYNAGWQKLVNAILDLTQG